MKLGVLCVLCVIPILIGCETMKQVNDIGDPNANMEQARAQRNIERWQRELRDGKIDQQEYDSLVARQNEKTREGR